jgi:hypothetical protein
MAQPCGALDAQSIPANPINHDNSNAVVVPGDTQSDDNRTNGIEHLAFRLGRFTQTSAGFFSKTGQRLVHRYMDTGWASRDFLERMITRAKRKKQDHPVELLITIAGAAFVVGVLARVLGTRDDR